MRIKHIAGRTFKNISDGSVHIIAPQPSLQNLVREMSLKSVDPFDEECTADQVNVHLQNQDFQFDDITLLKLNEQIQGMMIHRAWKRTVVDQKLHLQVFIEFSVFKYKIDMKFVKSLHLVGDNYTEEIIVMSVGDILNGDLTKYLNK